MSKNLFTKPIENIDYYDIETFFNVGIAENVKVDYKENFPEDLAKYITGFANKYGGILLIGIKANKTTNKPTSIPGINLVDGLEEKVISISQASINPPITPEVCVCPFKSKSTLDEPDRAVIIIRIQESFETPHMYIKKKKNSIYIREHNETLPAELRTIEELLEKREDAEKILKGIIKEKIINVRHEKYRTFFALPAYPAKDIIHFNPDVDIFLRNIEPLSHLKFGDFRVIQNGVIFRHGQGHKAEITREGFISYKEFLRYSDFGDVEKISIELTMIKLLVFLKYVKKVYEKIGYYGKICIGLELTGVGNYILYPSDDFKYHLGGEYRCNTDVVYIERFFSNDEFTSLNDIVKVVCIECFRAFGFVPEEGLLKDILK